MTLVLAACGGEREEDETQPAASPGGPTTARLPKVEEPPPTPRRLVGTWSQTGTALLFRFNADGTFAFDRRNLDAPYARGTYELDGRTISLTSTGPGCTDTWEWETGIAKEADRLEDELHIVFTSSGCEIPRGAEWTFARIS
jgi:hypothetical protein